MAESDTNDQSGSKSLQSIKLSDILSGTQSTTNQTLKCDDPMISNYNNARESFFSTPNNSASQAEAKYPGAKYPGSSTQSHPQGYNAVHPEGVDEHGPTKGRKGHHDKSAQRSHGIWLKAYTSKK
ncbi:uncharacterized protein I206_107797 [Kwoniella pini CBS 10737]|uniref:Uncharacterized protein n=1 Tax=Kwoniella pini CBS 10737 TaxID=1296096 RepID=A0A1B9HYB4_9TREE|nr:uncharacterized protein I206_06130 [Kwoniella pini CBS 10737]OCF48262.1 hypothetical protein I206_06130 [Kwoniella pini CBS 10737]